MTPATTIPNPTKYPLKAKGLTDEEFKKCYGHQERIMDAAEAAREADEAAREAEEKKKEEEAEQKRKNPGPPVLF